MTNPAGTVFRISEGGDFANLYSFDPASGDGTSPTGLAASSDGNLYGTTSFGGTNYLGTIFRMRPNGSFQRHPGPRARCVSRRSSGGSGAGPRGADPAVTRDAAAQTLTARVDVAP